MQLNDVRPLFPEFADQDDLRGFLSRISGPLVDEAETPADRTADLIGLGALCNASPGDTPARFDAFALAFSALHRAGIEAVFAGSPLTARRAPALTDEALAWLAERVQNTAVRTLVVALDLLRKAGALPGDSSDERLWHFCDLSGRDEFRTTLLAVFPELGRQLTTLAGNTLGHVRRMVHATTAATVDGRLPATATGDGPVELVGVQYGLGDTHAGGQAVCRLTFGTGRLLVYKPRSMAAERAYGTLVGRIGAATGFPLPVLRVWCGDECGWQEYADQQPAPETPAYFRACGHLLGVLHLLRAGDMHYENVLNHRGRPVVVDAESLFSVNYRAGSGRKSSPEAEALADTVFSTGFLPTRISNSADAETSIDIGFLGYVPGQQAVTASPTLEGFGTDQPRVTLTTGSVDAPSVRPTTISRGVELLELAHGFAELYDWAVAGRSLLEAWLPELFADLPTRAVLENTSKYYKLLRTAAHPTFQQSTDVKRMLLHRVGLGRVDHFTVPVVRAEIGDLLQGDIPFFTLRTGSTWVHHRGEPIADVLRGTPLAHALAGIREMSAEGRERNLRVIRAAYVGVTEPECDAPAYLTHTRPVPDHRVRDRTRDVVRDIATELHDAVLAGTRADRPAWIGATIRDTKQEHPWRVEGLADDLYAGVSGMSMFLAAAGLLVDDARLRSLARDALRPRVQALLDDPARRRRELDGGLAGGYPGVAFAALEVGRLTGSAELTESGALLWDHLVEDAPLIADADYLMGSTGLLAAALTVGRPSVVDAMARRMLGSLQPKPGKQVYSGFAHGTSGQLAALTRYHVASGGVLDELTELTGRHDAIYNEVEQHWPISDLAPERSARGWCHGTPGVLLGVTERLAAGMPPSDHPAANVAELAETVATAGFGLNLSLCHGDVGNLLILGQARRWDASGRTSERVADRQAQLVIQAVPRMLGTRVGKSVLNDSLYIGLAGIGLGLVLATGEVDVASPLTFRREVR